MINKKPFRILPITPPPTGGQDFLREGHAHLNQARGPAPLAPPCLTAELFLPLLELICNVLPGVNIIPKKADFLDPKIIFAPNLKKCPQLKFFFQVPQTHLPPLPPI